MNAIDKAIATIRRAAGSDAATVIITVEFTDRKRRGRSRKSTEFVIYALRDEPLGCTFVSRADSLAAAVRLTVAHFKPPRSAHLAGMRLVNSAA